MFNKGKVCYSFLERRDSSDLGDLSESCLVKDIRTPHVPREFFGTQRIPLPLQIA